ncbi:hypothetical protein AAFF_G00328200 [Aldrovandia affinis]|uniref:Titin n=1 Tax=Aldrovandia affinis TaxID=143900 RepID=A0AAD7T9P2_9TELE|nr:hypothetical protein AAFF_G00328200 [Aldrovandia affinis]
MITPVTVKDQLESPEIDMRSFPHNIVFVRAGSNLKFEIPLSGRPLPKRVIKGNEYIFRVRGVNKYGIGDPLESEPVVAKNAFVIPGKPSKPEVSMITKSTMTVIWERPVTDGGSDVDGYYLEKREKKSLSWFKVIKSSIRDSRQKVSNLTEGNEYQYRVCAINKAGEGQYSDVSDFYKAADPVDPPSEPTKLKVVDSTKTSITLGWVKPVYDGGSEITSYIVEQKLSGEIEWVVISSKGEVRTTEYVVSYLKPGVYYFFRVSAVNSVGHGQPIEMAQPVQAKDILEEADVDLDVTMSTQYTAKAGKDLDIMIPLKVSPPSQSSGLIMTRDESVSPSIEFSGEKSVTVKAGENININAVISGRPVPQVTWFKDGKEIDKKMMIDITTAIGSSTVFIGDVNRNHRGVYSVEAKNSSGTKKEDILVRVQDTPGKPDGPVRFTNIAADKATIWWNPPENDGCSAITQYVIEKRETSRISWALVTDKCEACSFNATKLIKGNEYQFRISAVNKFGVGKPLDSEPIVAEVQFSVPDAPGTPDSTHVTGDSITVTWTRPKSDGGNEIKHYILERREKKSLQWYTSTRAMAIIKFCDRNDTGKYILTVKNASGVKTASVNVKVLDTPGPCEDKIKISRVTEEKCTISWKIPLEDGGDSVAHYIVERRETSRLNWAIVETECKTLSCVATRMIKNNEYIFRPSMQLVTVNQVKHPSMPSVESQLILLLPLRFLVLQIVPSTALA